MSSFQFTRVQDGKKQRAGTLKVAIGMTDSRETWLFVSPHDDDLVMGAGLWTQADPAMRQAITDRQPQLLERTLAQLEVPSASERQVYFVGFAGYGREAVFKREVFAVPLAKNFREVLCGEQTRCLWRRRSTEAIAGFCKDRWIVPRSERDPSFKNVTRDPAPIWRTGRTRP